MTDFPRMLGLGVAIFNPSIIATAEGPIHMYRLSNVKRCEMRSRNQNYQIDGSTGHTLYWSKVLICTEPLRCYVLDVTSMNSFVQEHRFGRISVVVDREFQRAEDARGFVFMGRTFLLFGLETRVASLDKNHKHVLTTRKVFLGRLERGKVVDVKLVDTGGEDFLDFEKNFVPLISGKKVLLVIKFEPYVL